MGYDFLMERPERMIAKLHETLCNRMKITSIEPLIVHGNLINWVFVKVTTDDGLVGWGEATLEWKPKGVVGCLEDLAPLVVGLDPRRTEHIWQVLFRQGFIRPGIVALAAISGIDQACWDIHAKSLGVPLYQLLGGTVREKVRMYTHLAGGELDSIYHTETGAQNVDLAQRALDHRGFTAIKVLIAHGSTAPLDSLTKLRHVESLMGALREGLGEGVDIMLDFHGRCSPDMGIQYGRMLEPFHPFWFEEPCPPDNIAGLAKVSRSVRIPVASGERLVTRHGFRPLLEQGACAVIQPDVCHTGGITEIRKIASMADTYNVAIAPHNPMGPLATAVNLHVAMATPNFLIQEAFFADVPWRDDVVTGCVEIEDGYALPLEAPGIGIEIDEHEARKHPYKPDRILRLFHADGAVADW